MDEIKVTPGVFSVRAGIYSLVLDGCMDERVTNFLLPDGAPLEYERSLWDYKTEVPLTLPSNPNDIIKQEHGAKMAEIVKDAVSFHNSYGGYLVIGVADRPKKLVGFSGDFDVDDLNKRIKAATGVNIDCHFSSVRIKSSSGTYPLGLLYIPQRSDDDDPIKFQRNAPESRSGQRAYQRDTYYLRDSDECRPAKEPGDLQFLCRQGRRRIVDVPSTNEWSVLDSNLGPRDPEMLEFIGRESYLSILWNWLLDRRSPCKVLAGFGGVGKTGIAFEFAESVIKTPPRGYERLIWVSAKPRYFKAISDTSEDLDAWQVSYGDCRSLLLALLYQLGHLDVDFDSDASEDEIAEVLVQTLDDMPCLLVIDDLDSLSQEEQSRAFHSIIQVVNQTSSSKKSGSKVLITARLDLGASPSQLLRITGLPQNEFDLYVGMWVKALGLDQPAIMEVGHLKRFRKITDGSPIFANSVLRLVLHNEPFTVALDHWKNSDGEEVRRFTFEREISFLGEMQTKVLYAICQLGSTSLVELEHVVELNRSTLRDAIAGLRQYHLVVSNGSVPAGGPDISVPSTIKMMKDLLKKRVTDFNRVESRCKRVRSEAPARGKEVGLHIARVVSLWRQEQNADALEVAEWAVRRSDSADLICLLGRAFLRVEGNDNLNKADAAFARAKEEGCQKTELFELWVETKKLLHDWHGIVRLTQDADKVRPSAGNVCERANAYKELAEAAVSRAETLEGMKQYRQGAEDVSVAFAKNRAHGRVAELLALKSNMMRECVSLAVQYFRDPDEQLYVWHTVWDSFQFHVRHHDLIQIGVTSLASWWSAVEHRDRFDERSPERLDIELSHLQTIGLWASKDDRFDGNLEGYIGHKIDELETKKEAYLENYRRDLHAQ